MPCKVLDGPVDRPDVMSQIVKQILCHRQDHPFRPSYLYMSVHDAVQTMAAILYQCSYANPYANEGCIAL